MKKILMQVTSLGLAAFIAASTLAGNIPTTAVDDIADVYYIGISARDFHSFLQD